MTTITQKRKKSVLVWVLIILVISLIVGFALAHVLGVIDLSFVGDGFLGVKMWSSMQVVNALLETTGWIALGVLGYWIATKYFIGQKVTLAQQQTYMPQGQTVSNPQQQQNETVIS
jgi:hypothetical protein